MTHLLTKKDDFVFGFDNEILILNEVNERYPETFKTLDPFEKHDFRNDSLKIDFELKSRRIYKGQYPTIFFSEGKLLRGRDNIKNGTSDKVIYLFNFVAKTNKKMRELWYWEDDGSELTITMCGNYQRGEIAKRLVNVPMGKLKKW
tara:strand:+ start:164 stop:601 length:438 start_codon:yes stop_codon:yes gene_type:complete